MAISHQRSTDASDIPMHCCKRLHAMGFGGLKTTRRWCSCDSITQQIGLPMIMLWMTPREMSQSSLHHIHVEPEDIENSDLHWAVQANGCSIAGQHRCSPGATHVGHCPQNASCTCFLCLNNLRSTTHGIVVHHPCPLTRTGLHFLSGNTSY